MKKVFGIVLAAMLAVTALAGCSGGGAWKDGTYKAVFKNASHDWTEYLEVTVGDGKITSVDFDAVNPAGEKKSENQAYEDMMKEAGSAVGPMEFYKTYEDGLIAKQSADKVDAVAGATQSFDAMKKLFQGMEKNMANGDTAEVIVDNPAE